MRFSFVLVAGPRRHLSLGGDQSGSSRPTETKCYGSGPISCVLDAADARAGHDRPEGFEIEIELDVVDYVFPI